MKVLDPKHRAQNTNNVKKTVIMPLTLYTMYLLFTHPAGWLVINFIVPMKALSEYSEIHEKILKYIMTRDEETLETK